MLAVGVLLLAVSVLALFVLFDALCSVHVMRELCVTARRKCFKQATRGQRATGATSTGPVTRNAPCAAICDAFLQAAAAAKQHQGGRRRGLQGLSARSHAMPAERLLSIVVARQLGLFSLIIISSITEYLFIAQKLAAPNSRFESPARAI